MGWAAGNYGEVFMEIELDAKRILESPWLWDTKTVAWATEQLKDGVGAGHVEPESKLSKAIKAARGGDSPTRFKGHA